ncbi:hypothetical protein NQZ68_009089 [Dissostichus eleginoides]|nr:hypothetical protein NQZ68_009089 [Dissostichus eleginoides]
MASSKLKGKHEFRHGSESLGYTKLSAASVLNDTHQNITSLGFSSNPLLPLSDEQTEGG